MGRRCDPISFVFSYLRIPGRELVLASEARNIVWLEMMLKTSQLLLSLLLLCMVPGDLSALGASQENQPQSQQPQEQQTQEQQPQEGEQPFEPPRIVGRARSQEEFDDWKMIEQSVDPPTRVDLARRFLATYPDSGLTAFAHQALAQAAFEQNDTESFIRHAEEALLELPETPELLAPLAFLYSEQRQVFKATDYANRALLLLDQMENPTGMSSIQWITQSQGLRVRSYYALGRSQLQLWRASLSPEQLQQAIEHFTRTLELDPEHGYAAFRLGYAQLEADNPGAALKAYARAAVLDSPAAEPSRGHVEKIHADLKKDPESARAQTSLGQILKEERKQLEAQLAEIEAESNRLAAQIDSRELLQKAVIPPGN